MQFAMWNNIFFYLGKKGVNNVHLDRCFERMRHNLNHFARTSTCFLICICIDRPLHAWMSVCECVCV